MIEFFSCAGIVKNWGINPFLYAARGESLSFQRSRAELSADIHQDAYVIVCLFEAILHASWCPTNLIYPLLDWILFFWVQGEPRRQIMRLGLLTNQFVFVYDLISGYLRETLVSLVRIGLNDGLLCIRRNLLQPV